MRPKRTSCRDHLQTSTKAYARCCASLRVRREKNQEVAGRMVFDSRGVASQVPQMWSGREKDLRRTCIIV